MSKQLGASLGFCNILWKAIVKQKVPNQAMTLETLGIDGSALIQLAREVRSGDPSNREALAAKTYFPLLKPGYTRETICPLTSALNYGYAAVRSTLARHVVSHGFITSVGFHHSNDRNEFNLVDDLVEPFGAKANRRSLAEELRDWRQGHQRADGGRRMRREPEPRARSRRCRACSTAEGDLRRRWDGQVLMDCQRIILLCDLPVEKRGERKHTRLFRVTLFSEWFYELQPGIWERTVESR